MYQLRTTGTLNPLFWLISHLWVTAGADKKVMSPSIFRAHFTLGSQSIQSALEQLWVPGSVYKGREILVGTVLCSLLSRAHMHRAERVVGPTRSLGPGKG